MPSVGEETEAQPPASRADLECAGAGLVERRGRPSNDGWRAAAEGTASASEDRASASAPRRGKLAPCWTLALVLALAGCATTGGGVTAPTPPPAQTQEEVGKASWYGRAHQGRTTASGEVYDMYELTAAHPTLPMGARVLVTNLANGRRVVVRINDRGPIVRGRIIDLSYAAARELDAVSDGTFTVRIRVLSGPSARASPPESFLDFGA